MELLATVNGIDLLCAFIGFLIGATPYLWARHAKKKSQISVAEICEYLAELDKAVKTAQKEKGN
jgi:hypothetical protein